MPEPRRPGLTRALWTRLRKSQLRQVLQGRVGKLGNRVGITARLIDGIEDRQAWSEGNEGFLDDIFGRACIEIDWLNFTRRNR